MLKMTDMGKVNAFLDRVVYEEQKRGASDFEKGTHPFITISREAGAGGHTLAFAILEHLSSLNEPDLQGWQMFDQELCGLVGKEPGITLSAQKLFFSEYRSQIEDMLDEIIAGESPQDAVIKKMFLIIRRLASYGKVILVGRGASCLTRELIPGIHIRLVASLPGRIRRMAALLKTDEKHAREIVSGQDRARQKLVKTFFGKEISDPLLYDLVINTDTLPIKDIAELVAQCVHQKKAVLSQVR